MRPSESESSPPTSGCAFATTHWTVVLAAKTSESNLPQASAALTQLCQTYWPPLFAYLRRQGYSPHDAEDLVQGFFQRFLARDYLHDVAREKGRFRSFLLASLRHYAANHRRDQNIQRRGGGQLHIALDEPGVVERCEAVGTASSPELAFDRAWAGTVMDAAARQLRDEYQASGREKLYETIRAWLAAEAQPGDYARCAPQLEMTEGALAVAVHRLRLRFRELVRTAVAHTVQSPTDIEDEMRHLLRVLTEV